MYIAVTGIRNTQSVTQKITKCLCLELLQTRTAGEAYLQGDIHVLHQPEGEIVQEGEESTYNNNQAMGQKHQ